MSRRLQISGAVAIVICGLTLCGSLGQSFRRVATDPISLLSELHMSLADAGLAEREDVVIEMNGREIALGFSRPGCDGLLLLAILPHTAQSWRHIAPRLDLSPFELGYLYDGVSYPSVPRFERLAGRLLGDLSPQPTDRVAQVVAVAEAGQCSLARSVVPALDAVSRGRSLPAWESESALNRGGAST